MYAKFKHAPPARALKLGVGLLFSFYLVACGTPTPGSSSNSSSSSSTSLPNGSGGDPILGENRFFGGANCISCHGSNGNGTFANLDVDNLLVQEAIQIGVEEYIYLRMPLGASPQTQCDRACAKDIAAYLRRQRDQAVDQPVVDGTAHLRGEVEFDNRCASCHSDERLTGLFSEASLRTKGIFRRSQLQDYIDIAMPASDPSSCTGTCASDVAAYIITWHVLPIDPAVALDKVQGGTDRPLRSQQCTQSTSYGDRSLRLLTPEEYQNTVKDLFGYTVDIGFLLPVAGHKGSFTNNSDTWVNSSVEYSSIIQAAEKIAQWSADNNFNWAGCGSLDQNCASRFMSQFAPMIFRRALTDAEKTSYTALVSGQMTDGDIKQGLTVALGAMLSSPQFLYRHEIGEQNNGLGSGAYELTSYEVAAFLSYTFTRSTPTGALWQAAQSDRLRDPARIRSEASTLLNSPAAQNIMDQLVHDWLKTDAVTGAPKDPDLFGNVEAIKRDMVMELSRVFRNVMLNPEERFSSLYAPGKTFVNSNLANHYGLSGGGTGNNFTQVNSNERGGILLSGAFLTYHGDFKEPSPIRRAAYIRRNLLCQFMPPPPAGVNIERSNKAGELGAFLGDPQTTNRMAFHRLTEGPVCLECHAELINPLGFGLEDYDTLGRFRFTDAKGNSINARGRLFSPFTDLQFYGDPERDTTFYDFEGGRELAQMLATGEAAPTAKACLAMQLYNYATGVLVDSITDSDSASTANLEAAERDGYNCDVQDMVDVLDTQSPRDMLESMGTLESIRYRRAWNH